MTVSVIYNPTSGKGIKKETLTKIKKILIAHGYEPTFYETEYALHAEKIVYELEDTDWVISIGGDGTFSEVTSGNLKRINPFVLSHLPLGTTNDIGVMYGYGKDIIKNLEALLKGKTVEVDICYVNEKPFIYSAALGKFVKASYDTPKKVKKKFGYLAYLIEGLKELRGKTKLYDFTCEIEDETILGKYSFILVSNATRIAGINHFYSDVKLDDGKFEVLLCSLTSKKDIVECLLSLAKKNITKVSGIDIYKTNSLKIKAKESPLTFSLDGEKYTTYKKNISFEMKRKMNIKIPSKNVEKLIGGDSFDQL